ncbi:TLC domain-containing protein 2-like [Lytechinus pictus]|uniref:TLC domain-containing protein 2-like n=1 Tax=Lytechinus variegatus TaxID=7654 RepID=UPI001BB14CF3|nr:TLC domain-containing protein 2-like [Lytechinus variegatus]
MDQIESNLRRHVEAGLNEVPAVWSVVLYTLFGSVLGFQCYNQALNYVPAPDKYSGGNRFKWRNVMASFLHAFLTGTGSLYCLYTSPFILDDLIHNFTPFSEILVSLSTGYFVYDFLDMLAYKKISSSWPLLLHHIVIFTCFGVALYYQHYIGYAVVALMAEVNSIFLHLRQLLLMNSYPKSSTTYIVNSIVNVITYIMFRFGVLIWMAWWLSQHTQDLPITMSLLAGCGLTIMITVNFVLFLRLLVSDFFSNSGYKDVLDK